MQCEERRRGGPAAEFRDSPCGQVIKSGSDVETGSGVFNLEPLLRTGWPVETWPPRVWSGAIKSTGVVGINDKSEMRTSDADTGEIQGEDNFPPRGYT